MRPLLLAWGFVALTACGIYTSPQVLDGVGSDANVRIVEMNPETVAFANRTPYEPRRLPSVFDVTAGTGSGLRGVGAIPDPPQFDPGSPARLDLRPPPSGNPGPYLIGVGDVILLATSRSGSTVEELSGLLAAQSARQGYTVQDDGTIAIPDVGRVEIAGMTITEAEAELFQRLVENQIDPSFSLEIADFNSQSVTVGGAVSQPTVVPIGLSPVTLDQALAAAGGISAPDQDFASIRVYRDGTLYQIPLDDFYQRGDLRQIRLLDGDSVFVDTSYDLDRAQQFFEQQIRVATLRSEARQNALSELQLEVSLQRSALQEARQNFEVREGLGAVVRDHVYVTGEVTEQRRFTLPFEQKATLADALFDAAGGIPLRTGDVSEIYVLRSSQDPRDFGAVTAWRLNARNAVNFVLASQFELRPADVIFVAEQPVTRWNRVFSQITPQLVNIGLNATE